MKKYLIYTFVLVGILFASCDEKEDYEQINSQVMEASGEWWVQFSATDYETGYIKVLTFNTADDVATEMWLSDDGNWKDVLVRCPVDVDNLTFSGSGLSNLHSDATVTIANGKIEKDGGESTSGVVTDKISFTIEFSSEPGVVYQAVGTRKTGFVEDEH